MDWLMAHGLTLLWMVVVLVAAYLHAACLAIGMEAIAEALKEGLADIAAALADDTE